MPHADEIAGVTRHYLDHRFDLLGSGWVVVRHGMPCSGVEGHTYPSGEEVAADPGGMWLSNRLPRPNVPESRRIWKLVDQGYRPIDWQLDFKSGWRWSERTWHRDIQHGRTSGADIKVPWELARMQHLPQLALAAAIGTRGIGGFETPDRYAREFRNQVLDFIATNPPRFGVNWTTGMDVAIRVANWLVAYDLFRVAGTTFDSAFESVLRRSVFEHGEFVAGHLEWGPRFRGNHYLADVVGLLFVAVYLARSKLADKWLAFAVQEIISETAFQFTEDGANFEGSTCYHRLSAEMVVYAVAVILGLDDHERSALVDYEPGPIGPGQKLRPGLVIHEAAAGVITPLPRWLFQQVQRMGEFTADITKPNGRVPQVGDNDSGRFVKLIPIVKPRTVTDLKSVRESLSGYDGLADDDVYWDEDHLDHGHLVRAINGLLPWANRSPDAELSFEATMLSVLARGRSIPTDRPDGGRRAETVVIGERKDLANELAWINALAEDLRRRVEIRFPSRMTAPLQLLAYPEFGVFLARSAEKYLAIRCGPSGNSEGGHAHNDQLSIELNVGGEDWIRDPGTYLYTPIPERRNEYRSVRSHFVALLTGPEPSRLDLGPFRLGSEAEARCLYWGSAGFVGRLRMAQNRQLTCCIEWSEDRIILTYGIRGGSFHGPWKSPATWRDLVPSTAFSPGYGIRERPL